MVNSLKKVYDELTPIKQQPPTSINPISVDGCIPIDCIPIWPVRATSSKFPTPLIKSSVATCSTLRHVLPRTHNDNPSPLSFLPQFETRLESPLSFLNRAPSCAVRINPYQCCFCSSVQTIQHLFFGCHFASSVWNTMHINFGIQPCTSFVNWFGSWL